MNNINPFLLTDAYKTGHHKMYPKGTEIVYSNFTPRSGKHSNTDLGGVVSFGQQMVIREIQEIFHKNFFNKNKAGAIEEIRKEYSMFLNTNYNTSHIEDLWELGHLPIHVKSLPEGVLVPYGVPVLTVVNTDKRFFWITNFLETLISNMLWLPMTSATTAYAYKKLLTEACLDTNKEAIDFVEFQGHNFGMRGMAGIDATVYSGLGHATSFKGDDSLPTIVAARKYYNEVGFVVGSVNATEHSVMCAGGAEEGDEIRTFNYLMEQFPTGILSIVSDTWDLWKVLTEYLPALKDIILARDGKIVIRPDSGDPVDIICGLCEEFGLGSASEDKGVIELLWDIFGGATNAQGYKVLDSHIGAIYGDSITLDRAKQITERLEAKGFASTNIVLGIGSYTYQYVTRDTHGFAMKATYVEIDGKGRAIFKDPITDDGTKKSAKGLLSVWRDNNNEFALYNNVSKQDEEKGELVTIFKDDKFENVVTLGEVRERINNL